MTRNSWRKLFDPAPAEGRKIVPYDLGDLHALRVDAMSAAVPRLEPV
jgi:hypothetical protein